MTSGNARTISEQLARLQSCLSELRVEAPCTPSALYPGQERYTLITQLLSKVLSPGLVESLQQRLTDPELQQSLSGEELEAHRLQRVLLAVDVVASAEVVRGCVPQETSLQLLQTLADLAACYHQCCRDAVAAAAAASAAPACPSPGPGACPSPRPGSLIARSTAPSTTPRRTPGKAGPGDGGGGVQGGVGMHLLEGEGRLLDGLVERLPALLEQGGNWFPGDILAAAAQHQQQLAASASSSGGVPPAGPDGVARAVGARSQRLRSELPLVLAEEERLAQQVALVSDAEWQQRADDTSAALVDFLASSNAFYATFTRGLGVWCAASEPAATCGLGPLASQLLQRYGALQRLAGDLGAVRQAYNAIVGCEPPLSALEPTALAQLVASSSRAVDALRARIAAGQATQHELAEVQQRSAAALAALGPRLGLPVAAGV